MVVDHDLSKISQNLQKHIVQRRKWKADGHACVGCSKIFAGTWWSHWRYQVISTFSLVLFLVVSSELLGDFNLLFHSFISSLIPVLESRFSKVKLSSSVVSVGMPWHMELKLPGFKTS